MRRMTLAGLGVALAATALTVPLTAQTLGTFRWQLQPYCNVIAVTVVQQGGQYQIDGTDDQCGAGQQASVVGRAFPNPDGSIGFGLSIVTTTAARPVHVDVRLNVATLGGTWTDSVGNTGSFVFTPGPGTGGNPRPVPTAVSASAVNVSGPVSAESASVTGALAAGSMAVGAVTAGPLTAESITTPALRTEGPTDVTIAGTLRLGGGVQAQGQVSLDAYGFTPGVSMFRWNGSRESPFRLLTGDGLGRFLFYGSLGQGARRVGASIQATATQVWDNGNGASLTFSTGQNNSNVTQPRLFIDHNGEVGIGTLTPDSLLSVNGTASKVGGGTWSVFSDERLKTIRGAFTRGLADVMRLEPMRFEYRPDNALGLKGDGEYVGFSAQAVREVIPEAVSATEQGFLQLQSDPLLWAMLNAIKELEARTRAENARLRGELEEVRRTLRDQRDR